MKQENKNATNDTNNIKTTSRDQTNNSVNQYNKEYNTSKQNTAKNKINLDYDWNSEYGDGDIPNIDK